MFKKVKELFYLYWSNYFLLNTATSWEVIPIDRKHCKVIQNNKFFFINFQTTVVEKVKGSKKQIAKSLTNLLKGIRLDSNESPTNL